MYKQTTARGIMGMQMVQGLTKKKMKQFEIRKGKITKISRLNIVASK